MLLNIFHYYKTPFLTAYSFIIIIFLYFLETQS